MTSRYSTSECERIEAAAARLGVSRTKFIRHCTVLGLREVERAGAVIESPIVGALLQMFAELGPDEVALEFKRIRSQLRGTDDSHLQNKFPFVNDPDADHGLEPT